MQGVSHVGLSAISQSRAKTLKMSQCWIIILAPMASINNGWFSPSNSSMWKKQVLIDERTPSVNQDGGARQEWEKNPRWRHSSPSASASSISRPCIWRAFQYTSSLGSAFLPLLHNSCMSRHQEKAMRPEYSSDNNSCQVLVMNIITTRSVDPAVLRKLISYYIKENHQRRALHPTFSNNLTTLEEGMLLKKNVQHEERLKVPPLTPLLPKLFQMDTYESLHIQ